MSGIAPVCSSSKGNCVFVGDRDSGVLVDAGCSFKALRYGLSLCGIDFSAVKAVLVTHEHIDHTKALLQITKHTKLPVYASEGTINKLISEKLIDTAANIYSCKNLSSAPVDMDIKCFATPHDSAESLGYTFLWNEHKVAVCTDLGKVTDEVKRNLTGCDTVYLEANYDPLLLKNNPKYPYALKQRISSDFGHLSNPDSAEFCSHLVKNGARRLILGHLSQENNTPDFACKAVQTRLASDSMLCGSDYTLDVAPVVTSGKYIVI